MCFSWDILGLDDICLHLKREESLEKHFKFVVIHVAGAGCAGGCF